MSGSHAHALYVHADSALHRVTAQVKIVTAFGFVIAVVVTPRSAFWAFAVYAGLAVYALSMARIPLSFAARRMVVEVPFVVLAVLFPLLGPDPRIDVVGVSLSQSGLWDMWNLLAKASLGLVAAVILGGTTEIPDLLRGLDALRVPRVVTAIVGFAVRYVDVIAADLGRMRVALASRGHTTKTVKDWGPYGRATGAMFVRTYERGERIYLAMASRGYDGTMPDSWREPASPGEWVASAAVITLVFSVATTALVLA